MDYNVVEIDKTNKPDSFQELYHQANPLPGARPKVPLLHLKYLDQDDEEVILYESTVIAEYLATLELKNSPMKDRQSQFWPTNPKERAKLRLFMELCGSSFSSYLAFTRAQDRQQVDAEYSILKDKMREVDIFLSSSLNSNNRFTLADAHMAPFVQRCCGILPEPYDPTTIADDLELVHLQPWIQKILQRDSVLFSAPPPEETEKKRVRLVKRLARIEAKSS